jgi:hypothetical protein
MGLGRGASLAPCLSLKQLSPSHCIVCPETDPRGTPARLRRRRHQRRQRPGLRGSPGPPSHSHCAYQFMRAQGGYGCILAVSTFDWELPGGSPQRTPY